MLEDDSWGITGQDVIEMFELLYCLAGGVMLLSVCGHGAGCW
jgi:hypothetical protein